MERIITFSSYSHIGSRPVNEDSCGCFSRDGKNLFVRCDGLGGHGMGDVASSLAVACFEQQWGEHSSLAPARFLENGFQAAQDLILAEQKRLGASRQMKTTGVALLTDGRKAWIAHVGDSRCYVFRDGKAVRHTQDHSIPGMLALTVDIQESEIRGHSQRSILLRVLGVEGERPQPEFIKPLPLKKCDAFLLCSDGFWELIEEADMERYLAESLTVREWLGKMATHVQEAGKDKEMDNNTAIAVWCRKGRK